jgi:preprotein translocase subunit YajC
MTDVLLLIGQAGQTGATPQSPGNPFGGFLIPMVLAVAVFMYLNWRGQKKDRDRYQQMLNTLGRNDRVQTIGGIYGTVVETRENELVLKIDETNNVKIRVNRNAIKEVINKQAETQPATAATSS